MSAAPSSSAPRRVAYLGPAGTYGHEVLTAELDGREVELVPCPTIHAAVMAVQGETAQQALVPMENSLEGAVNATLDVLSGEAADVSIVGEVVHRVRHRLVARVPTPLEEIRRVRSHPQASAQCARFLREALPRAEVVAAASTAEAVRTVAGEAGPSAALGTRLAAELYGCTVLAEDVADDVDNLTRFVWLARGGRPRRPGAADSGPWKTSVAFSGLGAGAPGWLVRCLSEFAFRGVNLTRIESRPLREGLGSYRFFVDLEGAADEPEVAAALDGLHRQVGELRVLGSYPLHR